MKTRFITIASCLAFCFLLLTAMNSIQDTETFEGVYDGHEDYGYNFIGVDEDMEEYTMTFQKMDESLIKSFDLKSDKLIGTMFSVTYSVNIEKEVDEDGYEDETEIYTILALKKL
ncbi:hypothetical protein [uncultured Psychroserpens sp.]|uniref:hypothetical protein n=1 Tax=uncultured Psychroserpens sp. TaxID=255436 RepID=UPI002624EEA3|nr:hypothetical protein [uncultured Psychroserpens sp.]